MVETIFDTGYEPKFCVDVSSEHAPLRLPLRSNSFKREDDLTNTIAASEDVDRFLQPAAASGSQHSAANTVFDGKLREMLCEVKISTEMVGLGIHQPR